MSRKSLSLSPSTSSRCRGDHSECNTTPIFWFVFSTRLPGILTTKSAYFVGSVMFRLLCPPLSLVCVLVLGGIDVEVVAVWLWEVRSGPYRVACGLAVPLEAGLAGILFRELYLRLDWVGGSVWYFWGVVLACITLCHWCVWRWCACYCSRCLRLVHNGCLVHQLPCVVLG